MNARSRLDGVAAGSSRHGLLNRLPDGMQDCTEVELLARYANQLRAMARLGFHLRAHQRTPGPGPQVRAERRAQQPQGPAAWPGDLIERDTRTRVEASRGSGPRSAA